MDEINPGVLTQLITSVQQSPKYAQIAPSLVERIAREELQKRSNFSESVKAVRSRLHQLTGAYLPTKVDYAQWSALLGIQPKINMSFANACYVCTLPPLNACPS